MEKKFNLFERFLRRFDVIMSKIETFLSVGSISLCGAILLFSILNRALFKIPLRWTEEACRMLMIISIFSAQPIVTREKAHLKLAFLSEMLKGKKGEKIIEAIADASIFVIFTFIFVLFFKYTISATKYNQVSPAMGYPMWILYAYFTLTFFDTAIRAAMVFWDDYISKKNLFTHGDDEFTTT